jgi:hypothetical protein
MQAVGWTAVKRFAASIAREVFASPRFSADIRHSKSSPNLSPVIVDIGAALFRAIGHFASTFHLIIPHSVGLAGIRSEMYQLSLFDMAVSS